MKQFVILAGGKGTRLRDRLGGLPKPLIDICGVPLLERQIVLAKKHGFSDALILVNYAAEYIVDYCAAKQNWGLNIDCIDDGQPLGTAGATLGVFDRLANEFLVMYGDTMLEVDLTRFHSYHAQVEGTAATLFLHPNDHPQDSDLVELDDDGRVIAFHPYPHDSSRYYPNLVNAALYWVNKQSLAPWQHEKRMLDFGKDIFPAMLHSGSVLRGYISPEYIKDIGTPARLNKVCADFQGGKIERASLDHAQAIVFIDRDGTINREVDQLRSAEQFELLPGVEDSIRRLNRSSYRCCVVTNQPVIARGECSYEGLRQVHNKMETLLGRGGAFVDRIYFCPHHPHGGFSGEIAELKVDCNCRKPKTGMIDRAIDDFHGARELSWLVGDTTVDVETARRSGVKSILVETGYAGLDYREWAVPDAIVPDLGSAVSFILDHYPRLLSYCSGLVESIEDGAIVLIGGLARSGKSTFAGVLRDAIRASGRSACVLSIDRWLLSEKERASGVLGRYDLDALQSLVASLEDDERRPTTLTLPSYHKLKLERVDVVENLALNNSDVILIEGTVALALQTSPPRGVHRYHVEIDEQSRRLRVLSEYRLRGYTEDQALGVYFSRQGDEYPVVEGLAQNAHRVSFPNLLS